MLLLVLDTATPAIQAATCRVDANGGVRLLAHGCAMGARSHGELLAPAIAAVLADTGASPSELDAIVVGIGPGPFTGLRVGLVTAAAMGQALLIPAYGVCSLDGIGGATAGHTLVATDARRKEVYWARYREGVREDGPGVGHPEEVGRAARREGAEHAAGEGAKRYAVQLGLPVLEQPAYPYPAVLARLGAERAGSGAAAEPLNPLYLRRPDAVAPGPPKPVRQ